MLQAFLYIKMTYPETLDWLFTQTSVFEREGASAYKPGLATITSLLDRLDNPHRKIKCIHVAGTNGKGSTTSTLAAIFQAEGFRTGLFTSPHLVDFRERIRVNGEMISESKVIDFVEKYCADTRGLHPSFFELTTAMAFDHFAKENVDIAIIEVGLGGRLDSTNVITPMLSIITNISADHTALLGNSLREIATEKAGIIKDGVPVIIGEASDAEVREVFDSTAAERHSPILYAPKINAIEQPDGSWIYPDHDIHGALRGIFQPQNASTVLTALRFFPKVSLEAIKRGFSEVESLTGLRGRLTVMQSEPIAIVYDTGHNPGAWHYLSQELSRMARPLTIVCGFAADKDVDSILQSMPIDASFIFCKPSSPRGLDATELHRRGSRIGLIGEVATSIGEAMARAQEITPAGGTIFIGGSNFLIADLLQIKP